MSTPQALNLLAFSNTELLELLDTIEIEIGERQQWALFKNGSQRSLEMTLDEAHERLEELAIENPDHDYGIQPVRWNDGTPIERF